MKSNKYLYLLPLIALLPIFIFRDYTPDNELRYVSIIEEALRNGTFFTFSNHGVPYADKPPLYFWILMVLNSLSNLRLMSVASLATLIPVVVIYHAMNRLFFDGAKTVKFTPTLMLITSVMFLGSTVVMRMDILMLMFIILSLTSFYRLYCGTAKSYERYMFPLYVFLAIFSKGAVGLLVPLLTTTLFLAFERKIKSFSYYWGWRTWGVILSLVVVWFLSVYLEGGYDYIDNLIFKQTIGRTVNSFHHKKPFYYYLTHIWHSIAPWSLLSLVVIVKGFRERIIQSNIVYRFAAISLISTFVALSLVSSKIDIYMLPIYPFVIYLTYDLLQKVNVNWMERAAISIPAIAFALTPFAFFYIDELLPMQVESMGLIYIGIALLSMGGILTIYHAFVSRNMLSACRSMGGGLILSIFVMSFKVPEFNDIIGFEKLAYEAKAVADSNSIDDYSYYKFRGGENMDVFLGVSPQYIDEIENIESLNSTILFVRDREIGREPELKELLDGKEVSSKVGAFNIYVFK